jgi:hypothetical protein
VFLPFSIQIGRKWTFLLKRKTLFSRTFHFGTIHPIELNSRMFLEKRGGRQKGSVHNKIGGEYIN